MLVEGEARRQVVADLELRVEAGLDRPLAQQVGREGVDGLDPSAVEVGHRVVEVPARTRTASSAAAFSVRVMTASS